MDVILVEKLLGTKAAKEWGDSTSKQHLQRLESNKNYLPSNYYLLGSENRTAVLLIITRRKGNEQQGCERVYIWME